MLDLGAGLKGASRPMQDRGWHVTTLDIDPRFNCDITADVRMWDYTGPRLDLLWFSMPCDEFSRESMPWSRTGIVPDVSLILSCLRIVKAASPVYWICENTRGAIPWLTPHLGNYRFSVGPFYLWGFFPPLSYVDMSEFRNKERLSSSQPELRAQIPYALGLAIAIAIERQAPLIDQLTLSEEMTE